MSFKIPYFGSFATDGNIVRTERVHYQVHERGPFGGERVKQATGLNPAPTSRIGEGADPIRTLCESIGVPAWFAEGLVELAYNETGASFGRYTTNWAARPGWEAYGLFGFNFHPLGNPVDHDIWANFGIEPPPLGKGHKNRVAAAKKSGDDSHLTPGDRIVLERNLGPVQILISQSPDWQLYSGVYRYIAWADRLVKAGARRPKENWTRADYLITMWGLNMMPAMLKYFREQTGPNRSYLDVLYANRGNETAKFGAIDRTAGNGARKLLSRYSKYVKLTAAHGRYQK